ncbi:MAG: phosphoribosylformylglycinamidine synthase subunit PurL, partial [Candidatus Margulisbacteria bacterium]|nr:phosphoribosylformylglycinamidine synthase subunit PurL [Candidatus Margulisiibacteriota bacterium]
MKDIKVTPEIVKEHGLTPEEYERIKKLIGKEPNITELGMFSVLWSEHCSYKNSKPLLKMFPTKGPFVLQGPGENAGIIDIGDGVAVSFKIESHNHPSAIEPYQGAATGSGGIIRDIFAMGARPIACLDSLRFGDITRDQQSRHLFEYVVKGIGDYGNCVGIPTIAGEVYFEDSYEDNCLVNAMCVGIVQSGDKEISPLYGPIIKGVAKGTGNPIFYVGASTGRDGIHGATFASVELTEESTERKSSVQVGDPFQEKLLIEACLELLKTGCVVGLGDMGAAGLTSSLSEMATRGGHGVEIDVALVPQREKNMTPYEIMLSESQERMVVVVEKGKEKIAQDIFKKWDLYAVEMGHVTDDNKFRVLNNNEIAAEIPSTALTDDAPLYQRESKEPEYLKQTRAFDINKVPDIHPERAREVLLQLMGTPNIASKKWVYEQYDYMVQTNTEVLPGYADAAVLNIKDINKKLAVKTDGNGRYCYLDPFEGGKIAVAESARNVVCTGAVPAALTNCLNFGNPEKPESFWQLKKAIEGMTECCKTLVIPVISGNVSLYNESEKGSIYPTPVVAVVGVLGKNSKPVTMSFKDKGDIIYLAGDTSNEICGSEYLKTVHKTISGIPPHLDVNKEKQLQQKTLEAISKNLIHSAHDLADGGLAVALAECMLEHKKGAVVELSRSKGLRIDSLLFGESQSRIIFSVEPKNTAQFEKVFENFLLTKIGKVTAEYELSIQVEKEKIIEL